MEIHKHIRPGIIYRDTNTGRIIIDAIMPMKIVVRGINTPNADSNTDFFTTFFFSAMPINNKKGINSIVSENIYFAKSGILLHVIGEIQ